MWIQECRHLYSDVLHRRTKQPVRVEELEKELLRLTDRKRIVPEALSLIEEGILWPYPHWWPKLSRQLTSPVPLPLRLNSSDGRQKAVEDLLAPLKHIEVVSILLRFTCPREFGVMSPPALGLLAIVPGRGRDSVSQYCHYLSVLGRLRDCYQGRSGLENIADYDMALWTAAHLEGPDIVDRLRDEMEQDDDFQQIRLGNLMESLACKSRASINGRLLLAEALLPHDHVAAAVIVARCYEQIMHKAGERVGRRILFRREGNPVGEQLAAIEDELRRIGVDSDQLAYWWGLRIKAIHGHEESRTGELHKITWAETKRFLAGVRKLARTFAAAK